jgi:hypothetical protein
MKSKTYNGEVRSSEKDFETLQLGAFATPGLLLAQGPEGLTAESRFKEPLGLRQSISMHIEVSAVVVKDNASAELHNPFYYS